MQRRDTPGWNRADEEGKASISEQGEQVIRKCLEAINDGDREALVRVLDPSVEWHMIGFFLDQESDRNGLDEVWDYVTFLHREFEDIHAEPEEFIEMDRRMIVPVYVTARGVHSGAPGELRLTSVFTFTRGRIAEVRNYTSKAEALEAVGEKQ